MSSPFATDINIFDGVKLTVVGLYPTDAGSPLLLLAAGHNNYNNILIKIFDEYHPSKLTRVVAVCPLFVVEMALNRHR